MSEPGARRRGRTPGRLLAGLLAALLLAVGLSGAGRLAPARAAEDVLPVAVTIGSISPVAFGPDSDLTVTGTLRNTGGTALTDVRVNLRLDWRLITDRRQLAAWAALNARDPATGTLQETVSLTAPLAPGAVAPFSVSMKGTSVQLPVSTQGFGPRGMSVEAVAGGRGRVGIVRTFAVWSPITGYPTTRLSVLVPVTSGDRPVDPLGDGAQSGELWRSGGRLSRVLAATTDPGFGYAVDPSVLVAAVAAQSPAEAPLAPATGTPSTASPASPSAVPSSVPSTVASSVPSTVASTAPSAVPTPSVAPVATTAAAPSTSSPAPSFDAQVATDAKAWLSSFGAALEGRDVTSLPYGDVDVTALAAGGYVGLLKRAGQESADRTRSVLGTALPAGPAWPVATRADARLTDLAAASGAELVLPASAITGETAGGTAPVRADVAARLGTAKVLLADDTLNDAFARTGGPSSTLATQRLLAETAAMSADAQAETAGSATSARVTGPQVLATLPRDWNPDPQAVQAAISTLRTAPWLWLEQVTSARRATPVRVGSERLVRPADGAARAAQVRRLDAGQTRDVIASLARIESFAPAIPDRDAAATVIVPDVRRGLQLLSTAWIGRERESATARAVLRDRLDRLYTSVHVVQGSSANLLARTGQLPITIANDLPVPVTVVLTLHPTTRRVVLPQPSITVQLAAGRARTVRVALQAVANGQVAIRSTLTAPGGGAHVIGTAPDITVRVHSDWEGRGLRGIVGLLVLLLVAGLVRGVRRGRERVPRETVPDPDDVGLDPVPDPAPDAAAPPTTDVRDPSPRVVDPRTAQVPVLSAPRPRGTAGDTWAPTWAATSDGRRQVTASLARPVLDAEAAPPPESAAAAESAAAPESAQVPPPVAPARSGATGPAAPAPEGPGGPGDAAAPPAPAPDGDGRRSAGLLSSSAVMAAGTLVSRILGVGRVVALAWAIGTRTDAANAFATANTLPNSLLILVAGGVLNAVLVPQIVRAAKHPDGGQRYLDRLVTLAIVVLGGATILATALAPVLVALFGSEYWSPEQTALATAFAMWCLPQIFFYGLYTIYGQVLNARGSFGPYMWAPVVNNVVAIAGTVAFVWVTGPGAGRRAPGDWTASGIALLAGTATLGIVAQALVLLPALRRAGYRWRPAWGFRGMGLRTAGRVATWTFAATAVGQLAFVFISRAANSGGARGAASGGAEGRFAYDLAYQLFILPHSLVAVSIVTATFTRMAISASAGRDGDVRDDASLAVRLTAVATVPATVVVVVLSRDLTRAIFFANSRSDTDGLALVTAAMMLGLVPFSAQYLFSRIWYAYEDARTPFLVQTAISAIWAAGSVLSAALLAPAWVVVGIGLAMSAANLIGAGLSVLLLRRRLGGLDGARIARTHVRLAVAAVVAGAVGFGADGAVHAVAGHGVAAAYAALAVAGSLMLICYVAVCRILRVEELDLVLAPLMRRMKSRDAYEE